jgi:hypothetical protein
MEDHMDNDLGYQERSWDDFWNEGCRYLEVAGRAWGARSVFTPEILYHMVGMGLEGMFMAWLGQAGNLPENHTVRDLVRAAEKLEKLPDGLKRDLVRFDRFMGLCSLDPVAPAPPTLADVPAMLAIGQQTREYLAQRYRSPVLPEGARP